MNSSFSSSPHSRYMSFSMCCVLTSLGNISLRIIAGSTAFTRLINSSRNVCVCIVKNCQGSHSGSPVFMAMSLEEPRRFRADTTSAQYYIARCIVLLQNQRQPFDYRWPTVTSRYVYHTVARIDRRRKFTMPDLPKPLAAS